MFDFIKYFLFLPAEEPFQTGVQIISPHLIRFEGDWLVNFNQFWGIQSF
jgi:hypothetical protein